MRFLLPEFPWNFPVSLPPTQTQQKGHGRLHLKHKIFLSVLYLEILSDIFCDKEQNLVVPGDTRKALLIQTEWLLPSWGILLCWGWWQSLEVKASFSICPWRSLLPPLLSKELPLSFPFRSIFISLQNFCLPLFSHLSFSLMFLTLSPLDSLYLFSTHYMSDTMSGALDYYLT